MKTKTFTKVFSSIALALGVLSCKDNTTLPEEQTPEITLEAGASTATSLTVKVTPVNATECAVIAIESTEKTPEAEDIMKNGNSAAPDKISDVTLENLKPETEYNIFAVALNGETFSKTATIKMTTAKDEPVEPEDPNLYKMDVKLVTGDYLGLGGFDGSHEYYTTITDVEFDEHGEAISGGLVMELDIYGSASDNPSKAILPEGTYNIDMEESWLDKTIDANSIYSRVFRLMEDGMPMENPISYTSGSLNVSYDKASEMYDITGDFILEDDTHIVLTYKGKIEYANETGTSGEDITLENPVVHNAGYHGEGTGKEAGLGVYYVEITDALFNDEGYPISAGHHIYMKLLGDIDYDTDITIPEGRYEILPGGSDNPQKFYMSSNVTRYEESGNEVDWLFQTGSYIDVSYSGKTCTIDGHMYNDDGTQILFTYVGELKFENFAVFPVGDVTGAKFSRGEAVHQSITSNGTTFDKYNMTFEDKSTGVIANIILYNNANNNAGIHEISTGTYTATPYDTEDKTAKDMTFQLGNDPMLNWYYGSYGFRLNYNSGFKSYAKVTGGTVEVSNAADGKLKFDLKLTTIDGKLEGIYEGEIPFYAQGTPDPIGNIDISINNIVRQNRIGKNEYTNFYIELSDDTYKESKGKNGHMVVMDLYAEAGLDEMQSGVFNLNSTATAGSCLKSGTFIRVLKSGNPTDVVFESGDISVKRNEVDGNYEIEINMTTARNETVHGVFNGKISFSKGTMSLKATPILYRDAE